MSVHNGSGRQLIMSCKRTGLQKAFRGAVSADLILNSSLVFSLSYCQGDFRSSLAMESILLE